MKPFEANRLIQELSDQPERVRYLIGVFIREMQMDLNRLMEALDLLDAEKVTRISHRIKGAAGLIGAEPIRAAAALIEALGRQGNLDMALTHTADLQNQFSQFCTYIAEGAIAD